MLCSGAHVHMPGVPTVCCRRCSSSPNMLTVNSITRSMTVAAKVHQKDSSAGEPDILSEQATKQQADPNKGGRDYYVGLLKSDIKVTNDATSADMLYRSLQLAGGFAALLALLTYGFLASNGLA